MRAVRFLLPLLGAGWIAFSNPAAADPLGDCKDMFAFTGIPLHDSGGEYQRPLCRTGYVLSYNAWQRVPDWVLEVLTPERLDGDAVRKDNFHEDEELPESERATLGDYKGSTFDRGHMAPAADMAWDQEAMDESFLLSNMAPQVGTGFNRGIWKYLEEYVRDLAAARGKIVVITGPVYGDSGNAISNGRKVKRAAGGETGVAVPEEFYKIVYDPQRKRAIAFRLPNRKFPDREYGKHIVTIREIEDETGIEFFPKLSKRDRNRLETQKSLLWRVSGGS
jgi:endonuclease G